jgi:hypothetical protein
MEGLSVVIVGMADNMSQLMDFESSNANGIEPERQARGTSWQMTFGRLRMLRILFASVVIIGLACPTQSDAGFIAYTESITTSGTFNGMTFSGQLVTLTFTGDTTNVTATTNGFANSITKATVTVAGLGTATLSDTFKVGVDTFPTFSDFTATDVTTSTDILDTFAVTSGFTGVDLKSAFGPVSGGASYPVGTSFATSTGTFAFTQTGGGVSTASASVPEPSSVLITALGLVGVVIIPRMARRRGIIDGR